MPPLMQQSPQQQPQQQVLMMPPPVPGQPVQQSPQQQGQPQPQYMLSPPGLIPVPSPAGMIPIGMPSVMAPHPSLTRPRSDRSTSNGSDSSAGQGGPVLQTLRAAQPVARPPHLYVSAAVKRPWTATIRVCQYNVLADGFYAAVGEYAESTHGGFNDYSTVAQREWSYRFPRLMAEMDSYAADVYCLQEVQHSHYVDSFEPAFRARGFSCKLSRKTDSETMGTGERDLYCAMFVRSCVVKPLQVRATRLAPSSRRNLSVFTRMRVRNEV